MDEKALLERIERLEAEVARKNESNIKIFLRNALNKTNSIVGILIAFIISGVVLYAAQITFTDGTIISAADVNSNFTELYGKVGALEGKINTTFVRWGRSVCPAGSSLVYDGYAASGAYDQNGGGGNHLCMSKNPTWDAYTVANENGALIYGVEYEMSGYGLAATLGSLHDNNAPCAVCMVNGDSTTLMVPGTQVCPDEWNFRYSGYLMATHYTQSKSEFICVDREPTALPGGGANQQGSLLYPTEAECGSLPCAPYVQDRELTCSVCTR